MSHSGCKNCLLFIGSPRTLLYCGRIGTNSLILNRTAWIVLPTAFHKVRGHVCGIHLEQYNNHSSLEALLLLLSSRFGGVKYVTNMMRQIDSMISERVQLQLAMKEPLGSATGMKKVDRVEEAEFEMLDFALCLVDLNLSSKPSIWPM